MHSRAICSSAVVLLISLCAWPLSAQPQAGDVSFSAASDFQALQQRATRGNAKDDFILGLA
jgi:hypothetical protein